MENPDLLERAKGIRDEVQEGANTAERVGGVMVDIVESLNEYANNQIGIYVTTLNLFDIYDGLETNSDNPDYIEAQNIVEQWKAGKLVVIQNTKVTGSNMGLIAEKSIYGILNVYYENIYSSYGEYFSFSFTDRDGNSMQYSLKQGAMRWEVTTVGSGSPILLNWQYDTSNNAVLLNPYGSIPGGVYFLEGTVVFNGEALDIYEVLNLESTNKSKIAIIMNRERNRTYILTITHSIERISIAGDGTNTSVTATGCKLIKL